MQMSIAAMAEKVNFRWGHWLRCVKETIISGQIPEGTRTPNLRIEHTFTTLAVLVQVRALTGYEQMKPSCRKSYFSVEIWE